MRPEHYVGQECLTLGKAALCGPQLAGGYPHPETKKMPGLILR